MQIEIQKCIWIEDMEIHNEIQHLFPLVRGWLFARIKELTESGSISGIQCGEDEYISVGVEVSEESLDRFKSTVYYITSFCRYSK